MGGIISIVKFGKGCDGYMLISSKGRYAIRVMVYLAINQGDGCIPLKEITDAEDLSQKDLESITRVLSKGKLIEAVSGHGGGLRLTKEPSEYTLDEILNLMEGSLAPAACVKDDDTCCNSEACYTRPIWKGLAEVIDNYFKDITLQDVVDSALQMTKKTVSSK